MAAPRRVIEISVAATDLIELKAIARSRTEWACRVQRARILLAYRTNPSTYAVGEAIGVTLSPCNDALIVRSGLASWRRSTTALGLARSRRLPTRPALGWCRWPARSRRKRDIRTNSGRRG